MNTERVISKLVDGYSESSRVFDCVQVTKENIDEIIVWGKGSITNVPENPNLDLSTAFLNVETKLGGIYSFIDDWIYRTESGRFRVGTKESRHESHDAVTS